MTQAPQDFDKGTKVTLKNRFGIAIKGVVKRVAYDGTIVINGEDGARYSRQAEEVVVVGQPADALDDVEMANIPSRTRSMLPPPSEKLKEFDINKRFDFLAQLVRMVISKTAVSLIITGEGGLGKTYTVKHQIEKKKLTEDDDYVHIKGFSTPRGLFRILYENNGKLIIFDDCDEVLDDKIASNLLKGALDSYDERRIHWITKSSDESLPDSFDFTGTVIFISNHSKDNIPQALLSRAMNIDVSMNREEKIERMQYIISNSKGFMPQYTTKVKQECLDLIKEYAEEVRELSLRSLEKVLKIRAGERDFLDTEDPDYVEMDWKELAKFMLLS